LSGAIGSFLAFSKSFRGGVSVASGDVNGDGFADVIAGAGPGSQPRVRVFSGADGTMLADFLAFEASFRGGVRVSSGDFQHRHKADIVAAPGPGGAPRVRIFDADTQAIRASYLAYDARFRGGVFVGAGDINHDGTIDVITGPGAGTGPRVKAFSGMTPVVLANFLAYENSYKGGVRVDAVDADGDTFADIATAPGAGHSPRVRFFDGISLKPVQSLLAFRSSFTRGVFVAGAVPQGKGTNFELQAPVTQEIPVLQRLARYVPISPSNPRGQYIPVGAGGIEPGKNVYFVAHGWAPGYRDWVDSCTSGHVLKWWETAGFGDQSCPPPNPSPGPDSVWMFDEYSEDEVQISPRGGLAQAILDADPSAVVIAYSWIDDSATTTALDNSIPKEAYLSEALTNVNGLRLAEAVRQALGANYGGKVHLLGHSHGSKVVTLAAVALQDSPGYQVNQLTVFDSPESEPTDELSASNFLWHFLQQLNVSKSGTTGMFVDSYFSAFGDAYATMEIDGQMPLGNVVDTQLFAFPYSETLDTDPGDWHAYPPAWYAQSTKVPCTVPGDTNGGLSWSPLLGFNPSGLAAEWEQAWSRFNFSTDNQPCLTNPSFTITPSVTFNPITITDSNTNQPVTSIALGLGTGQTATFEGSYSKDVGESGISFDYTFTGTGRGILVIQVNDYLAYYVDSQYLTPGVAQHVTINIGWPTLSQGITVSLQPPAGGSSTAQVTLSNFQQFDVSLL
jgi:hypothetical protein